MAQKTFWDKFAFAYDIAEKFNGKAYRAMLDNITAAVPKGAKVLECAAGTGAISIAVSAKAGRVLCTDLSLPMLAQARRKAKGAGIRNIGFAKRNLLALPEGDCSFDAVIAANVIHLLDNPQAALAELWRVTKSGGVLIVPTFLTRGGKNGLKFLVTLYRLLGFRPVTDFTPAMYKKMLNNCGLPKPDIKFLPGKIPVGFAVFRK